MRKGKYMRSAGIKTTTLVLAMILMLCCVIGGTLAWLSTQTDKVVNTFTTSNIKIDLKETTQSYKMVPGMTIKKDPEVTVLADSEDCWLFVQVEESCTVKKSDTETYRFDDFIVYKIDTTTDSGWKQGTGTDDIPTNVYYRKVENVTTDRTFTILTGGSFTDPMGTEDPNDDVTVDWSENQVAVKPSVTKEMMNAVTEGTNPKLTFTAYAYQLYKTNKPTSGDVTSAQFTAADAWRNINSDN